MQSIIIIDKKRYKDRENEVPCIASFDTFITFVMSSTDTASLQQLKWDHELTPTLMF